MEATTGRLAMDLAIKRSRGHFLGTGNPRGRKVAVEVIIITTGDPGIDPGWPVVRQKRLNIEETICFPSPPSSFSSCEFNFQVDRKKTAMSSGWANGYCLNPIFGQGR